MTTHKKTTVTYRVLSRAWKHHPVDIYRIEKDDGTSVVVLDRLHRITSVVAKKEFYDKSRPAKRGEVALFDRDHFAYLGSITTRIVKMLRRIKIPASTLAPKVMDEVQTIICNLQRYVDHAPVLDADVFDKFMKALDNAITSLHSLPVNIKIVGDKEIANIVHRNALYDFIWNVDGGTMIRYRLGDAVRLANAILCDDLRAARYAASDVEIENDRLSKWLVD